jgi:hypothetical protein
MVAASPFSIKGQGFRGPALSDAMLQAAGFKALKPTA